MVGRTEFLTVGGVKHIALLHFTPAEEVLHRASKTTVTMEEDIEQHLVGTESADVEGYIVVNLVDSQSHIEFLYLLVVGQHLDRRIVFTLLYRK